ncbi:hypothetical protein QVD17_14906 [Tagetes erecta]|uniref:Uncharacterized protein n=1 Tax=Tagetes erecta TaxID=13708 RepID=A0AAD8KTV9_TARER|nr:hypothetical protein QVD17_14906 [Tagetes erecta]
MSAVCGPHIQTSAEEGADQTSAVCNMKIVRFLTTVVGVMAYDRSTQRCKDRDRNLAPNTNRSFSAALGLPITAYAAEAHHNPPYRPS